MKIILKYSYFIRSTRHVVRLTEIGQEYYQKCKKALKDLVIATELTSQESNQLSGIIKVNSVGGILGEEVIAPILLSFHRQNPKVNIHLDFSSHRVNFLDSDYDLVIRMGNLADFNLIVSSLRTVATKYTASRDFIQKHGQITNPRQLEILPLIYGSVKQCSLILTKDKYILHIHNNGIHVTSGRVMKQAVLAGLGIARLVDIYVESNIKNGNLIEVLPDYAETTELSTISLLVKHQLKRINSLIKYLKQHFNQLYLEMLSYKK